MKTAINLEPPSFASEPVTLESALQPGADVWVELLSGTIYPGKVARMQHVEGELSVETPAAKYMSASWKTLLFNPVSRKSIYGLATLHLPGIDPEPDPARIKRDYDKKTQGVGQLDEPEALSRENDDPTWEQKSTLEPEEERGLWYRDPDR